MLAAIVSRKLQRFARFSFVLFNIVSRTFALHSQTTVFEFANNSMVTKKTEIL